MIQLPSDVTTFHDDVYNEVTQYLQEQGHLEPDEGLESLTLVVEADAPVMVESYEPKQIHDTA